MSRKRKHSNGTQTTIAQAVQALTDLRQAVTATDLTDTDAQEATRHLDDAAAELGVQHPDPESVAGSLERLTRLLAGLGQLIQAAATLVAPRRALASWLGAPRRHHWAAAAHSLN